MPSNSTSSNSLSFGSSPSKDAPSLSQKGSSSPQKSLSHSYLKSSETSSRSFKDDLFSTRATPPSSKNSNKKLIKSKNPLSSNIPIFIGVGIGVVLFFILMTITCICCSKKKKKPHNPMQYYADTSEFKDDYYNSEPHEKWQNELQGMDHVIKHPTSPISFSPPEGGWHPSPPPLMINSADMSSSFSSPHSPPIPPLSPTLALGFNKSTFTLEELVACTNGFSQANLLGQGGFGYVHKGILPNGKEVAVKQLKSGSSQGEREFQAEVDIISRVHHRHLVSLVGYCIAGSQRMLVYDFVPNKTLEYHLHDKGLLVMEWSTRLKIALGSAKGLAYLHEDCHPSIIHRDIKSSNILLDYKFEAMVADFGLAKLSPDNYTHISTRVMGTFGYLAPEYASSGKLTEKSDVFSYGVMLLELITGRRPIDNSHTFMDDSLVDWARPILSRALADGDYDQLVDPRLNGNYDPMEMARMIACAAANVRHSAKRRPKMSQIVRALEGDVSLEDLNEGMRPGQSMLFSSGLDYDSGSYNKKMKRIRTMTLPNLEYSDEYSEIMDEYGHHHSISCCDGIFSDEINPIGNQKHRTFSPL